MALLKCHECNRDVRSETKACPNCGAKVKRTISRSMHWVARAILLFIAVLIVRAMYFPQISDSSVTPTEAPFQSVSNSSEIESDAKVTEAEFNRDFRCPESFNDEAQRKQGLIDMVNWNYAHTKIVNDAKVNAANFLSFRMKVLESHHCNVTLENIRRNTAIDSNQPETSENNAAPSPKGLNFNCKNAKSASEALICNDPELSKLDKELARMYLEAESKAIDSQALIEQATVAWKWRELNCSDKECLLKWYADSKSNLKPPNQIEVQAKVGDYGYIGVPGAIICKDYDTVALMIELYKNSAIEAVSASLGAEF